ncbi:MAG: DUF748 domain-containing protein [Campylobacterales bacterium]|nr:DUF748 domain-containing protein [Campylobacterales bacterium]
MFKKMLIMFFLLCALLFYTLIGVYIIPPLVKKQLIASIEKVLTQKASIGSISFNPFTFTLSIYALSLFDDKTQEPLVEIEEIRVNMEPSYLFLKEIRVASARVEHPSLFIRKNKEGELNLSDLLRTNEKGQNTETEKTELPNIAIEEFVITKGKIEISDDSGGEKVPQSFILSRASLNDFTTLKKSRNELQLQMKADDESHLEYRGKIASVEPLRIEGEIELHAARVQSYWRYIQNSLGLVVTQGVVDVSASHSATFSEANAQLDIQKYKIDLTNLLIEEKGTKEKLLSIPKLTLEGRADITNANYMVESADAESLFVKIRQNSEGEINWLSYFPKQKAQANEPSAIAWDIKNLKIKDAKVEFEDQFNAKNGRIEFDDLQLHAEGLSSKKQSRAKSTLSFRLNKTGEVEARSTISHTPFTIETELELSGLELLSFQPYLDKHADIKINSAVAGLTLKAVIGDDNKSVSANAQIEGLSLSRPHEKSAFLAFSKLLAKKIEFSANSRQLKIASLDLLSPYVRVDIDADQRSNLSGIIHTTSGSTEEDNSSDDAPIALFIDKITLKEGEVVFADRSLEIPFRSTVHAIKGSIVAAGNQKNIKSVLNLEGTIDKYATAKINGTLLSAQPKVFTRMDLKLKNINMSNLSSYSGRFIGYTLKKGKLDAELSYKIDNAQMKSSNKIVLKELELGKKVQSSTEASSSIELALSLLKDSRGEIDLDIPLSGNLDAPDFAMAPLILKAFRNLTVGIATAPFRFIGKLVGIDAQKLENIYFEAGKAEILPPEREMLEALGSVLIEKTGLILNISGAYEDVLDGMQIRKKKLYAEVLRKADEERMGIAQMQKDELDAVLIRLYEDSFGKESYMREKERNKAKNLDEVTEKEALRIQITEALAKEQSLEQAELEALAQERGESILNYLRSKGVEAEQLRLLKTTKTERSSSQNAYIPSRLTLGVKK